ncbi:MAG: hypothetical protein DMG69_26830 [Acidobacteria bacterium]|nr:MAG: hypothetical protein DMG69_26830 [Acidobacteriota bacterium]
MVCAKTLVNLLLLISGSVMTMAAEKRGSFILQTPERGMRVKIARSGNGVDELIEISEHAKPMRPLWIKRTKWLPVLSARGSVTRVIAGTPGQLQTCALESIEKKEHPEEIVVLSDCGSGHLKQTLTTTQEPDVIAVRVDFSPHSTIAIRSVEDRYTFAPGRTESNTLTQGPLDFVWSQNLKNEPDGLMPQWTFKSPAVMLQRGNIFAALMPDLSRSSKLPLSFDLDVTSEAKPWFSYGSVPSEPYGHSYFRRAANATLSSDSGTIEYSYAIVGSVQPLKLGYRRAVRRLWQTMGHPELLQSPDLQRNVRRPELVLFDDWRHDVWVRYASQVYRHVACRTDNCGTLMSNRNYMGDWDRTEEDAWFNSWFQSLRTAYGWYLYAKRTNDKQMEKNAEGILSLALQSPQQEGAFSTIYLVPEHRWIRDDGWAGFAEDYHAFCMSWTAYWMLKWAEDLTPNRRNEVLAFTRRYGGFLLRHQLKSGVIPSWYDSDLKPRPEFRDLNAETAGSALFLLELGGITGDKAYVDAATRAMEFITGEVLPRQLWWDFETFKSCARKNFDFSDPITAQYPQNNLSTIQAAKAYLKLYDILKDGKWLDLGTRVLDYLLLTQQVWSPPYFDPKLLGGFTTQNTDAEWSDARQCYAAVLLLDYYKATGEMEYLERAVAAARATFAVAPWENWAHTGYKDEPGAMTGFHWGSGSAMTSIEIMSATLGDAFIDLSRSRGVGFNANSLRTLNVVGSLISFNVNAVPELKGVHVRFAAANPNVTYRIIVNGRQPVTVNGDELSHDGYVLDLAASQ